MRPAVVAASSLVLALVACGSDPPGVLDPTSGAGAGSTGAGAGGPGSGAGGPGSTGSGPNAQAVRDFFEQNVAPILDDGAGNVCASCHASQFNAYPGAPHFMGGSPAAYYDTLVAAPIYVNAAPGNSKLITQGLHEGPAFTETQEPTVIEWLEMEAALRFGDPSGSSSSGGTVGGPTGEELLAQFAACMTLEDWTATGMHMVANQPNSAKSNCYGCHNVGTSANYMANPLDTAAVADSFEHMKQPTPLTKLVTYEVDATTGQATKLVQSYRWQDKGLPPTLHPKYILDDPYLESIDNWFAVTLEKCGMGGEGAGGGGVGGGGGEGGGI
jgi:cytochrome c553